MVILNKDDLKALIYIYLSSGIKSQKDIFESFIGEFDNYDQGSNLIWNSLTELLSEGTLEIANRVPYIFRIKTSEENYN